MVSPKGWALTCLLGKFLSKTQGLNFASSSSQQATPPTETTPDRVLCQSAPHLPHMDISFLCVSGGSAYAVYPYKAFLTSTFPLDSPR